MTFAGQAVARLADGFFHVNDAPSTADFGPFDVTEIRHPRLLENKLVFYVEDNLYSVPYRVEAPWPAQAHGMIKFLLLPPQE